MSSALPVDPASTGKSNRRPVHSRKYSLRHLLGQTNRFLNFAEVVTSRGLITDRNGRRVLGLARKLADYPEMHVLSITDNPGGNPMLSADTLGTDLLARGQEVVIHLSCKDWNRNALQSFGWKLASEGFENILALSGDFPTAGYKGRADGVFDTDSIGLLNMFSKMNSGLVVGKGKRAQVQTQTNFFMAAVVNNHKRYENEVMPQYFKLAKKIEHGAGLIISQIGYDTRKQDELLKYMHLHGMRVPVLANVYVLSLPAARFFHKGKIPGVEVTDALLDLCEQHAASPDKGKAFFLELAAKQWAIAKGLGYRGAYIGGHLKFEDYVKVIDLANAYSEDDWRSFSKEFHFHQEDEFYYFEANPETGLNSTTVNQEYQRSKSPDSLKKLRRNAPLAYKVNRMVHNAVFEKGTAGFRGGKKLYQAIERSGKTVGKAMHSGEQVAKIIGFDCKDCGDCSLPDIAYLCPESQCVKNERNGPCGGTRQGLCEVGDKECIWSRAYDRLKAYGEEEAMLDRPVVYKNGALKGTSAWANTFLERDHHAVENQESKESS
jgi:methylenetetrahydrofolate reductase (NADPH)